MAYKTTPFNNVTCELSKSKFDGILAYGHILINNALRVNITVREHNGKFYPCFPQQKKSDGSYSDMVFPVTKEGRAQIMNAIEKAIDDM